MNRYTAGADDAGVRLDVALATWLGRSRSAAAVAIAAGEVTVDGEVVAKNHRLTTGQRVEVDAAEERDAARAPALPPVRYRDEHLLVVAKPAGMVVHPGPGHPHGTLVDALVGAGVPLAPAGGDTRPGIVHRLDRDTSGLLTVASTDAAHGGLVDALRERSVTRRYLALVVGVPHSARGRIDAPIGRDPARRTRFAVVSEGKPAVTRYRVLATGAAPGPPDGGAPPAPVALLACRLETGRTHQIRVHLEAIGHHVAGDPVYRARYDPGAALGVTRGFLHAAHLGFEHPVTGASIVLDEPLPPELRAALARAGIDPPGPLSPSEA